MLRYNHKYLIFILILTAFLSAEELQIYKQSSGLYNIESEKNFQVEDKLYLSIDNYVGKIIINGLSGGEINIRENCDIKTYSENDARQKYYQSKVGFILNANRLEISGKKHAYKINSVIELDVPVFTTVKLEASDSHISLNQLDGDIELMSFDSDVDLTNISSKVNLKSKNCEYNIFNCSMVGDLVLSRGGLFISGLNSEYFNATLYGADMNAESINSKVVFRSTGGDIIIEESKNDAKLFTAGGNIFVEEIKGNLACDTKGGIIEIGRVNGLCKINCVSGGVSVEEARNDINIEAVNTEVTIESALKSVYVESSKKDIEVVKTAGNDEDRILIKNREAGIDLYLDPAITASINASIDFDNGDEENWEIGSDFDLENMKKEIKSRRGYISKTGLINGGGATVILKNRNGDIYIFEN